MGQLPTWLLEGYHGDEPVLLGVFTGEAKAEAAADAAEAEGYTDIAVTPYPANVRLWTGLGADAQRELDAQLEVRHVAAEADAAEVEIALIDADALAKANAMPVPENRRRR